MNNYEQQHLARGDRYSTSPIRRRVQRSSGRQSGSVSTPMSGGGVTDVDHGDDVRAVRAEVYRVRV